MEEQLENKKKSMWSRLVNYVKENPWTVATEMTLFALSIGEAVIMLKSNERLGELKKENQELRSENADLRGQIRANERENRRLGRDIGNLNYQLGKSVASRSK